MHPQDTTTPTKSRNKITHAPHRRLNVDWSDPQARAAYYAAYSQENREHIAVQKKGYRQENKKGLAAHKATYRQQNKEPIAAYAKVYYQEHKEPIIARSAAWYQQHPERAAARGRAWHLRHPEYAATQSRTYRQEHLEEVRSRDVARRLREREEMIAAYGGRCALCGEAEPTFFTLDHVNGGGKKDQRESGNVYQIYRRLKREGWPPTHQVLCANCNHAKEMAKRRGTSQSAILYRGLRAQALEAYGGGKCACCGETNPLSLEIDHMNGGGVKDRRESGGNGAIYRRLRREGWPPGHQVLCANCNMAKERPGGCPHQSKAPN